jgi:hypothetical protein
VEGVVVSDDRDVEPVPRMRVFQDLPAPVEENDENGFGLSAMFHDDEDGQAAALEAEERRDSHRRALLDLLFTVFRPYLSEDILVQEMRTHTRNDFTPADPAEGEPQDAGEAVSSARLRAVEMALSGEPHAVAYADLSHAYNLAIRTVKACRYLLDQVSDDKKAMAENIRSGVLDYDYIGGQDTPAVGESALLVPAVVDGQEADADAASSLSDGDVALPGEGEPEA